MRILIASDIHGSCAATLKLLEKAKERRPDLTVLLGDLLYHGPRNPLPEGHDAAETAKTIAQLAPPVVLIRGNCEAEVDQLLLPWTIAESAWLEADGRLIFAIHGQQLKENGGSQEISGAAAILYGHTHIPQASEKDGLRYWNPGSLSLPKKKFPPSYGWYENSRFQVLSLSDDAALMENCF
jgi:putative phosphoesterase